MAVMAEKLLTTREVAEFLNVNEFTVYRLVTRRKLPAFKVGNQWRFSRPLVEKWLQSQSNLSRRRPH
jgi:excisionase family DNA binding protein